MLLVLLVLLLSTGSVVTGAAGIGVVDMTYDVLDTRKRCGGVYRLNLGIRNRTDLVSQQVVHEPLSLVLFPVVSAIYFAPQQL